MPILKPEAPQASIAALHASLPTLAGRVGVRKAAPVFAAILASPHSVSRPGLSYPVYTLELTDLVSKAGLAKAKLAAWRHEYTNADEVVSAEVSSGRRPKFLQLDVDSRFLSIQHELQSVAGADAFASRSFELRLLHISTLGFRALWLRAGSGFRSDLVVPLVPVRRELNARQHYTPHEFIAAIKAAAASMAAAENPVKGA